MFSGNLSVMYSFFPLSLYYPSPSPDKSPHYFLKLFCRSCLLLLPSLELLVHPPCHDPFLLSWLLTR